MMIDVKTVADAEGPAAERENGENAVLRMLAITRTIAADIKSINSSFLDTWTFPLLLELSVMTMNMPKTLSQGREAKVQGITEDTTTNETSIPTAHLPVTMIQ